MRYFTAVLLLSSACVDAQQWQQLPDFPGTARDDAAAFAIGEHVYVGTGMEVGWALTNDWYRFDGSTMGWSAIAPLPASPRQYSSAFVLHPPDDAHGYLFGGLDANGPLNELWRYDPATDTWAEMASLPSEPRYATVAFNGGYVATGLFADGTATNELWKYDQLTDTWQLQSLMPGTARHRACGANWAGLMVIGGADDDFNALEDCWAYNGLNNTWTACASLPQGRYGAMCGFAVYDMMIIGGAVSTSTIVETALRYNSASWLPLDDPHPGGTRRGGIMIQAGGSGGPGTWNTYLGLGLSNDLTRHKDWYVASGAFGVHEHSLDRIEIRPNLISDKLWVTLPEEWPHAQYIVCDALGRTVQEQHVWRETPIDVATLSPGRYDLLMEHNGLRLRAPFFKLP